MSVKPAPAQTPGATGDQDRQPNPPPTPAPLPAARRSLWWRRVWRRRWLRWSLIAALVMGLLVVLAYVVLAVVIMLYGERDRVRAADVIVVLGGGPSGTTRRARHGAALYGEGYADTVICSGGASTWQISEAQRCEDELVRRGVPAEAIVQEARSRSTEENAIEVAALMQARDWDDAVLVTDNYHLWRATNLFRAEDVTVYPSPAQVTDHNLNRRDYAVNVVRELAATTWYAGKTVLGRDHTYLDERKLFRRIRNWRPW